MNCEICNKETYYKDFVFSEKLKAFNLKFVCVYCGYVCTCCGEFKTKEHFSKNKNERKGFTSVCKECKNEKRRESRVKLKTDLEYSLRVAVKKTIIAENRALKSKGKRLCSKCHNPYSIYDMWKQRICFKCLNKSIE